MPDDNEQVSDVLSTIDDNAKLANKIHPSRSGGVFINPKQIRLEERVQYLRAALDFVHDVDKIAIMEQTLIEHGLMPIVEKRLNFQFVRDTTFQKEKAAKEKYFHLWQKELSARQELEDRLAIKLGIKQLPGDEKW